jgi:hypothetical protein
VRGVCGSNLPVPTMYSANEEFCTPSPPTKGKISALRAPASQEAGQGLTGTNDILTCGIGIRSS